MHENIIIWDYVYLCYLMIYERKLLILLTSSGSTIYFNNNIIYLYLNNKKYSLFMLQNMSHNMVQLLRGYLVNISLWLNILFPFF